MTDLAALSDALADSVAAAAPGLVIIWPGTRAQRTGFALAPGLVVTSEQNLPVPTAMPAILPGGGATTATFVGRDPGTNVALLRLDLAGPAYADATPRTGALALALGAVDGHPTAALGLIHRTGPAWTSMAGGTVDQLIRLDLRLAAVAEGGPVLDARGALLGMSTFGPRRRVLVIPAATLRRVLPALEAGQSSGRGWLGVGLQPVTLPAALRTDAGRDSALMIVNLASGGPAEQAGALPGDILLDVDGTPATDPRTIARTLAADSVGRQVPLRLLRGGAPLELKVTIALRPAA